MKSGIGVDELWWLLLHCTKSAVKTMDPPEVPVLEGYNLHCLGTGRRPG